MKGPGQELKADCREALPRPASLPQLRGSPSSPSFFPETSQPRSAPNAQRAGPKKPSLRVLAKSPRAPGSSPPGLNRSAGEGAGQADGTPPGPRWGGPLARH